MAFALYLHLWMCAIYEGTKKSIDLLSQYQLMTHFLTWEAFMVVYYVYDEHTFCGRFVHKMLNFSHNRNLLFTVQIMSFTWLFLICTIFEHCRNREQNKYTIFVKVFLYTHCKIAYFLGTTRKIIFNVLFDFVFHIYYKLSMIR